MTSGRSFPHCSTGQGPWACFLQQHGPHRLGLGGVFQWALYRGTNWDVRAEAWCSVALLALAAVTAISLAARLRGRLAPIDAVLPLIILSPLHWETILLAPNLGHSILPLCLLLLLARAWLVRSPPWRTTLLSLLGALSVFTGFGFCAALAAIATLLPALSSAHTPAQRRASLITLGLIIGALLLFFIGYHWDPAIPGWTFPVADWWNYGTFVSYMMATLVGLREKKRLGRQHRRTPHCIVRDPLRRLAPQSLVRQVP